MTPFSINIRGHIREITVPQIMGIINVTPDSFYGDSRTLASEAIEMRTRLLIAEGADMIDVGAYSSRPGADDVSATEEMRRLRTGIEAIRRAAPDIPLSVDTFRADVARYSVEELGADIINDIAGGLLDPNMIPTVARLGVPYILMHMRGTPATMQQHCNYANLIHEVISELSQQVSLCREHGICDLIIDPGFGFSKNLNQNFKLLSQIRLIENTFGCPVLAGVSRKSMITKPLGINPAEALNGTTVIHTIALLQGAAFLRVHDAEAACQARTLVGLYRNAEKSDI